MHIEPDALTISSRAVSRPRRGVVSAFGGVRAKVMAACIIGNMFSVTPVVVCSSGLILLPVAHEFSWPRAWISGAFSLLSLITAFMFPIVGRMADRLGARRVILVGCFAFGLSVLALALSSRNIVWFYCLFAFVGVAGALPSTMMFTRVVSGWFDKGRGAMLGVAAGLGNGIGATVMPIIAAILMMRFGWRGAFLGLGGLVLTLSFPVLFACLRDPASPIGKTQRATPIPADADQVLGLSLWQAMQTATFWLMLGAIAIGAGGLGAVGSHIIPILVDRGFTVAEGTAVISTFMLVTSGWQMVVGWCLDHTSTPRIVAPFYLVAVAGVLLLEKSSSVPLFVLAGALMGIGMGSEYGILPYFISRYFGLRAFGSIAGVMYSVVILTQGLGPYLMDLYFDAYKTYGPAMIVIAVALVLGAAALLVLRGYSTIMPLWTTRTQRDIGLEGA